MKIIWSGPAQRDVFRIAYQFAEAGPDAALDLIKRIEASAAVLLDHPYLAPAVGSGGTRKWPISGTPFYFFYVTNGRIEIESVRHGREDWGRTA